MVKRFPKYSILFIYHQRHLLVTRLINSDFTIDKELLRQMVLVVKNETVTQLPYTTYRQYGAVLVFQKIRYLMIHGKLY